MTRRIVASSGIAAALMIVSPAAIAAADDAIGSGAGKTIPTDPTAGEVNTGSAQGDSSDSEPTTPPADDATENTELPAETPGTGEPESDGTGVPPAGGSSADDEGTAGAGSSDATPEESTRAPGGSEGAPTVEEAAPTSSATPRFGNLPPPGRHRADETPTGRHRAADSSGRHSADSPDGVSRTATSGGASPTASSEVIDEAPTVDEFVGEPGTRGVAAPATADDEVDRDSVFYRLTHNSGGAGLVFLNQSAVVAGVLNRRSRDDGTDYFGLLSPGERLSMPAQAVAALSLGDQPAVDDSDQSLITQAVKVLTARLVWWTIDPDNRYYDPSDFQVLIGDNYRIMDADGITYTYDKDADTITFTNTTDHDVAVIAVDQYNVPHGDGIYVVPAGESTTLDTSGDISGYVVQGERDSAGRAIIYGMVVVQDDSTLSYNFNPTGGPIRNADVPIVDPDNKFWDPAEGLATGILWPIGAVGASSADDGVYYSTDADGVTIHNDSDADIAIIVFSGTADRNLIPQTDFYVVKAGEAHTIELTEGSYALTSVQGERVVDGPNAGKPRLYGSFVAQGGPDGTSVTPIDNIPQDGIPPIGAASAIVV